MVFFYFNRDYFNPEKDEDKTITGGRYGLNTILDGGIAFLTDVAKCITSHHKSVSNHTNDSCKINVNNQQATNALAFCAGIIKTYDRIHQKLKVFDGWRV